MSVIWRASLPEPRPRRGASTPGSTISSTCRKPFLSRPMSTNAASRPGEDVVDASLVDVADDRARAAALQIELRDAVARPAGWRSYGAGAMPSPAPRGDGAARFQQRDPGLSAVDADQHLLLQLCSVLCELVHRARSWPCQVEATRDAVSARPRHEMRTLVLPADAIRAWTWIDSSRPMARKVTITDEPP